MRGIEAVRARKLADVAALVARASLYAPDASGLEMVARGLLWDLCYIDERESDCEAASDARRRYGKLGVAGAFYELLGHDGDYIAEVASVYAEDFQRFGYLTVEHRIDADAWTSLAEGLRETHEQSDWRMSEVVARYGSPSLIVDKRVLCYISAASDGGWACFDFWEGPTPVYVVGSGGTRPQWPEDLLLRSVRVPAETVEGGVILTLWGKFLRWGEGWQFADPDLPATLGWDPGILEQLRSIRAADPSQPGGTRRGDVPQVRG